MYPQTPLSTSKFVASYDLYSTIRQSSSVSDGNVVTELNQGPLTTRRKLNSIILHYSRLYSLLFHCSRLPDTSHIALVVIVIT